MRKHMRSTARTPGTEDHIIKRNAHRSRGAESHSLCMWVAASLYPQGCVGLHVGRLGRIRWCCAPARWSYRVRDRRLHLVLYRCPFLCLGSKISSCEGTPGPSLGPPAGAYTTDDSSRRQEAGGHHRCAVGVRERSTQKADFSTASALISKPPGKKKPQKTGGRARTRLRGALFFVLPFFQSTAPQPAAGPSRWTNRHAGYP
jgi:hypothetical protein